ncbi:MAG: leucine-rich repeat domain-containing protein, partial [Anaeroplasmataceae bacterium]|nr:leucine-rich repeat domain-containing protein [Anaeroplasmataceae bacterium]
MKKKICIILSALLVLGVGLGLSLFFGLKGKKQQENNPEELLSTGLYDDSGLVRDWENLTTGEEPSITVEDNVLIGCDKALAGELVLPEGILAIGINAFLECNLTKISLPSSLKEVARDAFYNSVELEEVSIPSNSALEVIGYGAFTYCHKLKTLDIPSTVTKIGVSAFLGCTVLDHIVIPNSITTIGDALFKDCEALNDLSYGDITEIGSQAFYNCRSLESFDFKSTTKIGFSAFWNCKSLANVDLPETLELMENHVFARCNNLTAVTFGSDATRIGVGTFEDCLSLTEVELPGYLDCVPEYCFAGCEALEEVVLG